MKNKTEAKAEARLYRDKHSINKFTLYSTENKEVSRGLRMGKKMIRIAIFLNITLVAMWGLKSQDWM